MGISSSYNVRALTSATKFSPDDPYQLLHSTDDPYQLLHSTMDKHCRMNVLVDCVLEHLESFGNKVFMKEPIVGKLSDWVKIDLEDNSLHFFGLLVYYLNKGFKARWNLSAETTI